MEKTNFKIRVAKPSDAEKISKNMKLAYSLLEDKTIYVCDDLNYVKTQISNTGFAVVACANNGEIVGSFVCRFPGKDNSNLGKDIGMDEDKQLMVVHMESVVVLPKYRGHHLFLKMLFFAENHIDKNKYKYLMATVSPKNPASYLTFERAGYKLVITKEKYGGLLRNIYLKEI